MNNTNALVNKQQQVVKCPDCGASFSIREEACPYCGHINEVGDELAYQHRLEDIREDLENLEDVPSQMYKKEMSDNARNVGKIALVIGLVLLILFLLIFGIIKFLAKNRTSNVGNEILQQRELFAALDELYEAGDFDSIRKEYNSGKYDLSSRINSPVDIYRWHHNQFMMIYFFYDDLRRNYDLVLELSDDANTSDKIFVQDTAYVFYNAAKILLTDWDKEDFEHTLTSQDYEKINEYKDFAKMILDKHFHMSIEDLEAIRGELSDEYSTSPVFKKCDEYAQKLTWYK